jgi:hypothetical protein
VNSQRNKSKTGRHKLRCICPAVENREQRRARLQATKDHAKRRARKLKYAKPTETPDQRAKRVAAAKAAALKVFAAWLESPAVDAYLRKNRSVATLVRAAIADLADFVRE